MACKPECGTCEQRTSTKPSCISSFVRYTRHACYTLGDGIINIYCALRDIATAIREYTDKVSEKGYASGIIHFKYTDAEEVEDNEQITIQFSRTPFNFKVLGIGVSVMDFNECGGQYFSNSSLTIRFWDFTTNQQIGDNLTITDSQLIDSHTNEGLTIDDPISPGHIYGVKITYENEHGSTCELPDLDFYVLVTPTEIITED